MSEWSEYRTQTGPIPTAAEGKRYQVVYSFSEDIIPGWYSGGEFRWRLFALMEAWTIADLGWAVKIIDRRTGRVLDGPKFNR